ncbi:MAG: hypothetical protein A6F72_02025 [Cycloclasticus sp. symbiont of Poecilosclerida sp. N]|nr:MAG: hypothetical protein A6F72_02025 [Cycloclasticus sp. symbiont of Poecilosclerida sp. N]
MIKVYTAQDFIEVAFWKNYLEQQGVHCQIRNEFLGGAMGEVPPIECWPELWLDDERDEAVALKHLASDPLAEKHLPEWKCVSCAEVNEGQFSHCWQCETEKSNEEY